MKRYASVASLCFCVLFFCLFSVFSIGMLIPGASQAAEGAEMPALIDEDGRISDGFGEAFETWFSRRFAFRGNIVSVFSALKEQLFGTGNEQVIVGQDGFLFFAETEDDFLRSDPMTDEEIAQAAKALSDMNTYAEAHGARFLFVCAPNKNTVYPDKMPKRYGWRAKEADGSDHLVSEVCDDSACVIHAAPSDLDRLYAYLDENTDVLYADVRPVLYEIAKDSQTYHKRDSHWNGLGAYLAFSESVETLSLENPIAASPSKWQDIHTFEGDLDRLLYPGETKYDDDRIYPLDGQYLYTSAFSTAMDMVITTRSAGEAGTLLMFRDSFASAMLPYFAAGFSECRFERAQPYRISLLEEKHYDYVIVEIAERNLRSLKSAQGAES